ncbi:MAG: hypothetical protein U1F43_33090 [Myxococcota bacterium]
MEGVEGLDEVRIETPFGKPLDALLIGKLDGVPVAVPAAPRPRHRVKPTRSTSARTSGR